MVSRSGGSRMTRLRNEYIHIFFSFLFLFFLHTYFSRKTRIFSGCNIFLCDATRFSSKSFAQSCNRLFSRHHINLELLKIRAIRVGKKKYWNARSMHRHCACSAMRMQLYASKNWTDSSHLTSIRFSIYDNARFSHQTYVKLGIYIPHRV